MSQQTPQPDPSAIGGVSKAPFAFLPDAKRLFPWRADRLDALAPGNPLEPYLRFLARLARVQGALAATLPPPEAIPAARRAEAAAHGMPPLDRTALAREPATLDTLRAFLASAATVDMPRAAAAALDTLREAAPEALATVAGDVAADAFPLDQLASHLFVAAGLQVEAARVASTLDAGTLPPVAHGICPVCGGPPVASMVVGVPGAEGARYAGCAFCGTSWNEVRITCLACGSTKGIGYRAVEAKDATVKAEVCDECRSWVKILYQSQNPGMEPVADDVASLGLDLLMREGGTYRHAGFNPFLIGY